MIQLKAEANKTVFTDKYRWVQVSRLIMHTYHLAWFLSFGSYFTLRLGNNSWSSNDCWPVHVLVDYKRKKTVPIHLLTITLFIFYFFFFPFLSLALSLSRAPRVAFLWYQNFATKSIAIYHLLKIYIFTHYTCCFNQMRSHFNQI